MYKPPSSKLGKDPPAGSSGPRWRTVSLLLLCSFFPPHTLVQGEGLWGSSEERGRLPAGASQCDGEEPEDACKKTSEEHPIHPPSWLEASASESGFSEPHAPPLCRPCATYPTGPTVLHLMVHQSIAGFIGRLEGYEGTYNCQHDRT